VSADTATVSIVATAAVGVAGIAAGFFTARGQRQHAERLATHSFIQTHRADAYAEILAQVHRATSDVERLSSPGTSPDEQATAAGEDFSRAEALVRLYGSKDMRDALTDWAVACAMWVIERDDGKTKAREAPYPTPFMQERYKDVAKAENALVRAARADLQGES